MYVKVTSPEFHDFYRTNIEDVFQIVGTTNYGDWLISVPDGSDDGGSVQVVGIEEVIKVDADT